MWLHTSEDECLGKGEYAVKEGESSILGGNGWLTSELS